MTDQFNGDNANLIASINALLALDASGSLEPHGIGGHARFLLETSASRLQALSHAAGQDGEQCRAASGDREAMATRLRELICEYWNLAYDEGVDKRNSDTPAGDANRVANEIETIIRALSRGVPEGDDSLPAPLRPVSKEWYRLCERRFAVDRITISGKLAEAIVDAVCGPAIAAQRKEGE